MVTFYDESPTCVLYLFVYDPYGYSYTSIALIIIFIKLSLSNYRLSSHSLSIEAGRFYNRYRNMRTCNVYYENLIEDAYHFIVACKKYDNIIKIYIKPYYQRRSSPFKLVQLLSVHNVKELSNHG